MKARAFRASDAAGVAALHARCYPAGGWHSSADYEAYLREVLLGNPWLDPEIPSWVIEDGAEIAGFLGVVPRRMRLNRRALRVAVSCQLMVAPERRASFAAVTLLRALFDGPQDLTVADGANAASRALWEAAGGIASPIHCLHWVRLLRPAQGLLAMAGRRLRGLRALAGPVAAALDACLALGEPSPALELGEEPLDARNLADAFAIVRNCALLPDYDAASLSWLLAQAAAKRRHGELQGALARDGAGRIAGWFLYYLNGALSQVVQIGARPGALAAVFEQLARHARRRGARALEGRLEPQLVAALQGKRCLTQNRPIFTLLHAREPALLVPMLRGDAFFSRLEGEWWMRFSGEAPPAAGRNRARLPHRVATGSASAPAPRCCALPASP